MVNTNEAVEETVMPFVLCRSNGGPHDDAAFQSGWRLGDLAATLAQPEISSLAESIRREERHQADLIAMARGYTMSVETSGDPVWLPVTFTRSRG